MSLDGNARRARKVSTELVKQKLDGVHKTWNELLENDNKVADNTKTPELIILL